MIANNLRIFGAVLVVLFAGSQLAAFVSAGASDLHRFVVFVMAAYGALLCVGLAVWGPLHPIKPDLLGFGIIACLVVAAALRALGTTLGASAVDYAAITFVLLTVPVLVLEVDRMRKVKHRGN
jgi:hypothetical protein